MLHIDKLIWCIKCKLKSLLPELFLHFLVCLLVLPGYNNNNNSNNNKQQTNNNKQISNVMYIGYIAGLSVSSFLLVSDKDNHQSKIKTLPMLKIEDEDLF